MKKIRVGLLVEEFFDKDIGGFGGYGILAREYICRYIPNADIEIEVIVGTANVHLIKTIERDGIKIHYLPKNISSKFNIDFLYYLKMKKFFNEKNFDIYLSIEMSKIAYTVMKHQKNKKLIMWIQDPRPKSDWDEIRTLSNPVEYDAYLNYYSKWEEKISKLLNKLINEKRLILISQGNCLKQKAIDLYKFPKNIEISYFPNPCVLSGNFNITEKKPNILFLGRLTAVKRPWIYFELAKKFPENIFYVCGQGEKLEEYKNKYKMDNLKFLGHISGEQKDYILRECEILINCSIHEAIPVSFLEAISYGLKIVSCQNPDNITSDNGYFTGIILGDGLDGINEFAKGIEKCLIDYNENNSLKSIDKIKKIYNVEYFVKNMRNLIKENIK